MTKKTKNKTARFWAAAILLLCAPVSPVWAQEADGLREGADYILLDPPQPTRAPEGKVEMLEFFNFSCPHCFNMQEPFARWQKETDLSDVALVHQPVIFASAGGHYARLYYTLEALGLEENLYRKVFNAIHRERRLINSRDRLAEWLAEQGADRDNAAKVYDSFSVKTKVARAERIAKSYGVNSTPQIAVAGKYLLTSRVTGPVERMLRVAAMLIAREQKK
ncbi:MAG: thiol:disulfide interchange protein DsbA/DsbL [Gammaproteobacteria bacterium]